MPVLFIKIVDKQFKFEGLAVGLWATVEMKRNRREACGLLFGPDIGLDLLEERIK